jgi:molybdopterin molybdotransferase
VPLIVQEGLETIHVHDELRVGLLTLGERANEAAQGPRRAAPAALVGALLRGSVEQLGATIAVETGVNDCGHAIADALASLHAQCELVIVIGFTGPTQAAELAAALAERGLDWTSQDLRARPLGALQLGHCATMPVVALSPDIGAAFAAFLAFVSPLIRRMQGRNQWLPDVDFGQLQGPMPHRNAWGFFCVTEARGDTVSTQRLQHCKRRDAVSAIAEASGLAWRPLDLSLHGEANVAFYPFHRWLR